MSASEVEAGIPFSRHSLDSLTSRILHLTSHFVQSTSIERLAQYTARLKAKSHEKKTLAKYM